LPLLNGVAHMDQLDATFGAPRVLGGVAHIAATLSKAGVVRQLNPLHILTMGHREPAQAPLARAFFEACKAASFDAIYSEDITQTLWDKWTFLATLAGSTTLFRSGVGAVTAKPEGAALMTRMYGECLAVAAAFGQPVGEAAQEKARGILMAPGSDFTASMLRDLLGNQRTEHEHILGDMARRATAKGIDAPLITAAYIHMVAETSGAPRAA
ncbi:MAG TPA: ketopantoate reductase C-terminal domain-containing protein, partial [Burkholderiaceae bacterium]|nr:ketopantoate reductase C-terminal domain-containing protein [Burkholderiaceae bacterium]